MNKFLRFFIGVSLICFFATSCKKEEGRGGKLSIKGKVYGKFYNKKFNKLRFEKYIEEEDVYIIYGDNDYYGDREKTGYDGAFQFDYLNKGKYKIYTFTTDLATQQKVPVIKEITIQDDATLDDFVINVEDKSFGIYAIRGKVYANDYDDTYSGLDGPSYYAMDEDVFLIEEGDSSYADKVSTNYNGMYEFRGLRNGKYKVYVFSENNKAYVPGGSEPVIKDVEIKDADVLLQDLVIIKN